MATRDSSNDDAAARSGVPRGEEKRQEILEVAARLFAENGGRPTPFEAIAAAAGVTRTALYYYFPTKAELVHAVLMRTVNPDWWTGAIEAGRGSTDFSYRLYLLLCECMTRSKGNDIYYSLIDAAPSDAAIRDGLKAYSAALQRSIRGFVEECCADGSLPPDADATAVTEGILGLIWCVASGLAHTTSRTAVREVKSAIELICGTSAVLGRRPPRRKPGTAVKAPARAGAGASRGRNTSSADRRGS